MPKKTKGNLDLEDSYTIEKASYFKEQLLQQLGMSPFLSLDLSRLNEADLSFYQILLAAVKEAKQRGGELTLKGLPTESFIKNASLAGFLTMNAGTLCFFEEALEGGIAIEQ